MSDKGSDSGFRNAVTKPEVLQTIGGILLTICMSLAGWALWEVSTLKVEHARLEERVANKDKSNDATFSEIKAGIERMNAKLDRLIERGAAAAK